MAIHIKYEHIKLKRTPSIPVKCPDRTKHNRSYLLLKYVLSNDIIKRADIAKMSFNNIDYTLRMFTKSYTVQFIAIDHDTWEKTGVFKKIKKEKPKPKVKMTKYRIAGKIVWKKAKGKKPKKISIYK